jgi:hypothetical protein
MKHFEETQGAFFVLIPFHMLVKMSLIDKKGILTKSILKGWENLMKTKIGYIKKKEITNTTLKLIISQIDVNNSNFTPATIKLDADWINAFIGMDVSKEKQIKILTDLDFKVENLF